VKQLAPDLFARRFGELLEIGRAQLPALAPEWSDHNAHDPGITLIELLAWVAEAQLYALSPRPRRDERIAYAALLGLAVAGPRPARGSIWSDRGDPRSPAATFAHSRVIPADAVVQVIDAETPTFRPTHRLLWAPGRIVRLETRLGGGRTIDHTVTNERGGVAFLPLGEDAGRRDVLAMTFECRDDHGLFGARRPDAKGALWSIGVRAAAPVGSAAAVAAAAEPEAACHSPLQATIVAGGERVPVVVAADSTAGLLRTGALLLDLEAVPGSPRELTLELHAAGGLPRPPRLLRIEPNIVPVEQGRTVERELHVATGLPDWRFELDVPGLRFAAGEEPLTLDVDEPAARTVWRRCDRLAERGPGERVYELDAAAGTVTFGNGVNGRIPAAGAQVLATYAVCDGEAGRVARNRRWRVAGFEGVFGVNHDAVAGGAAPSSSIDLRRDGRRRAREEHALVSAPDLVAAAEALPLLEVARAWVLPPHPRAPSTGTVTLVAMRSRPDGSEPARVPETPRWLAAVRRRLVARMPLGTRLAVAGPRYVDVSIRARLLAAPGRDPATVEAAARRQLARRLAPVETAAGDAPRRPGVAVSRRDVAAWLRAVDGVREVVELRLRRTARQQDESEVPVPGDGLPRLARSNIEVMRSGAAGAA
jgi:hypothetical protein